MHPTRLTTRPLRPGLRPGLRLGLRLGLLAGLLLATLLAVTPATPLADPAAAVAADGPLRPEPGHPWFGPALDIHTDTPAEYADRLGATPSLYTFPVDYPLTAEGVDQLRHFAVQMAAQGAVLVLQVEPTVPLAQLDEQDATDLADLVADLHDRLDTATLVRFAPEMNGSWRPWGQQPTDYVAAFREVAGVVHDRAPSAAMVWSPVYGSGYPFRKQQGADSEIDLSGVRQRGPLDTDGNGRLDPGDDPYGPYYPGDDAVDWVGLFLYRFGQSQGVDRNVLPPRDELASRLAEQWGYPGNGRTSFYERFSSGRDQPLLLETAALHNPGVGGAGELRLKQRWWQEVLGSLSDHPWFGAVSWLELARVEPEVADQPVDWRVTSTPGLASAFLADLRRSPVRLGPVTPVHAPGSGTSAGTYGLVDRDAAGAALPGVVAPATGETAARVAAIALLALLVAALLGATRSRWRYPDLGADLGPDVDAGGRDDRVDLLRGVLLVGVIAWHLPVAGPLRDLAGGAGVVAGLETFVLVSGVAVGLVYPPLAARLGQTAAAGRRWRRAALTWLGTLVTVLAIYVLGLLPGVDLDAVSAVGGSGDGALDLYGGARHLFDYPPPGAVARAYLFLEMGTWLLLPLALLIALVALSPLAAAPLQRGWWWLVLPASWGLYALGRATDVHVLPSLSEAFAPLLVWQLLFVHGIALGRHRHRVARFLAQPAGLGVACVVTLGAALVLWTGRVPEGAVPDLPAARLLVVAAAALVALMALTTCWRPVAAASGPVLLPLGRAPLPVVLAHAVLVVLLAGLPSLDIAWVGTVVTIAAIALLTLLARLRIPDPPRETVAA